MQDIKYDLKKLSVLFVEDEDSLRKAMNRAIGDEFDSFITAKDGDEGVKKFKKYKPDLIITDISMPIKDGLELAQDVKEISKDTPIIVLSAFSDKDRLIGAIDAGIDKYLIKPIDPEDLLKTVYIIAKEKFSVGDEVDLGHNYKFDKSRRVLLHNEDIINLTKKEILFISYLVKNLGSFVLHEDIKKSVWSNGKVNDAAVRTFIKRIRERKLIKILSKMFQDLATR